MKILLAYEHIRRLSGTHGEWITSIGRQLAQRGHDIHLLCDSVADASLYPEITFHSRRPFVRGESHRLIALHVWAKKQLREINHDISISFHTAIPAQIIIPIQGWVQTRLQREHRLHHNSLWTACLHTYPPVIERKFIESLIRKNHAANRHFVATSTIMRNALLERYPALRNRMHLIPGASSIEPPLPPDHPAPPEYLDSIRSETRRLLHINENDIAFLWGSKRAGWHGARFLIEAFAKMVTSTDKQNHARLILASEGQYTLHNRARKAGIADRVRIVGRTDHFNQLLAACDITVNPAILSHLGRFTWESLAFAKPVIASADTPGIERMRHPDQRLAGRIVQSYDTTTLRNALIELMDPSCRQNATRLAREIAPTMRFNQFIDRIEQVCKDFPNITDNNPTINNTISPKQPQQQNQSTPLPFKSISAAADSTTAETPTPDELITVSIPSSQQRNPDP